MKELLSRIEKLGATQKHTTQIERLVENLEKKDSLPQELQDKLSLIGNTPMKETKIAEVWKSVENDTELDADDKVIAILEVLLADGETTDLYAKGITLSDFIKFGHMAKEKVMGVTELNDAGETVYKEVESHKDLKPLSFATIKEIKKYRKKFITKFTEYSSENQTFITKLQAGDEVDIEANKEKVEKLAKEQQESMEEMNKRALEFSGISYENQTEWEQTLLANKVVAMTMGNYNPPMGKS